MRPAGPPRGYAGAVRSNISRHSIDRAGSEPSARIQHPRLALRETKVLELTPVFTTS